MSIRIILLSLIIAFLYSCTSEVNKKQESNKHELRIISLVPSITKEITELGLEDIIVGATNYCEITKNNKDLIIGSAIEINEEKIILLKPDIVFASTLVKQKSIEILKQNGIKVIFLPMSDSFEDLCDEMIRIGKILNKEETAIKYVQKYKTKLDSIIMQMPKRESQPTVFFQLGANPIATVIPNTYMNDFIIKANCKNIFYDLNKIIVNRESILLRNPDYIIISAMGGISNQEVDIWQKYQTINAVQNHNIFLVPSASLPTVVNFVNNFEIIINNIYFNKIIKE